MTELVFALLSIIAFQTIFFLFVINKLVNKLMSRDFSEYQQGQRLLKDPKVEVKYEEPPMQENMGRLLA